MATLSFHTLDGLPEIRPGNDLDSLIADGVAASGLAVGAFNVFVLAQKIVSKAEGRIVVLDDVVPSARAHELAGQCRKDARLVELVLSESTEVLRIAPDVLIVRHRLGFVMANAGIDQSNVPGGGTHALLLPKAPDTSAQALRSALEKRYGQRLAVIINDSFGRPWRQGTVGIALGASGLRALADLRGTPDRHGRALQVTEVAIADEIAAGASLLMGQAGEGRPAILVKGVPPSSFEPDLPASRLVRPLASDLFR